MELASTSLSCFSLFSLVVVFRLATNTKSRRRPISMRHTGAERPPHPHHPSLCHRVCPLRGRPFWGRCFCLWCLEHFFVIFFFLQFNKEPKMPDFSEHTSPCASRPSCTSQFLPMFLGLKIPNRFLQRNVIPTCRLLLAELYADRDSLRSCVSRLGGNNNSGKLDDSNVPIGPFRVEALSPSQQ